MNFDYGSVLTRAGQITWRCKSIWGLLLLPMLAGSLPFLLFLAFLAPVIMKADADISSAAYNFLGVVFLIIFAVFTPVNYGLRALASSAATLGVVRAERGEGSTQFMDLLRDGLPYFWRTLGVMLIVNLTIGLAFFVFSMLAFALILVTIGMASICLQPIMILLTPLSFLMVAFMESAQLAVIVDDMHVTDAIKSAFQRVRAHVWKYILLMLIVYLVSSILTSFIVTPLMLPIFFVPFLLESGRQIGTQSLLFSCIFLPLMILISTTIGVFMKITLDLTSLRLAQKTENQVIFNKLQTKDQP
ncbi:MAG: hypothetical protein K8S20_05580 [Chloroflexi bacterium]|nr:hypothetical protein [Chloroflexota bacterium]